MTVYIRNVSVHSSYLRRKVSSICWTQLIAFIPPSGGMEYSILLRRSSVPDKPMEFRKFRATTNRLQELDSFPDDGGSQNQFHKIVKKQMAVSDYNDVRKNKRSLADLQDGFGDGHKSKGGRNVKRAVSNSGSRGRYYRSRRLNKRSRKTGNVLKKPSEAAFKAAAGSTGGQFKVYEKVPDMNGRWPSHECETHPNGYTKLRQRRYPRGQKFFKRRLRCLDFGRRALKRCRRERGCPSGQRSAFETPDDSEPANEWLDASKGVIQKIPSEFKPKKKPGLKIYHLRVKRRLDEMLQNNIVEGHRVLVSSHGESHAKPVFTVRERNRVHDEKHYLPRSFVIRIHKKEGKDGTEKIADRDENDSEEEDEENDEEEEDEEEEAEDEEEPEEDEDDGKQWGAKTYGCKELLKSAKEAVTNRARFSEPAYLSQFSGKESSSVKNKKSYSVASPERENKNILIDANIKVDSALTDVFRDILKETKKSSNDPHINNRESQDQKSPELIRIKPFLRRLHDRSQ